MAQVDGMVPPVDEPREFHVGVLGATGFVGRLIADYLCRNYSNSGNVKFIFAGRNSRRLEELKVDICNQNALKPASINTAVADVGDYASLVELAKRCRVLISTVGPYMLYGEPVARACVEARTHYCDLTGEMPFVALLHTRHGLAAKERGVKLVSFCGFDSVPSDMCVYMIQKKAYELAGKPCPQVKMAVRSLRGGVSGATLASGLNLMGHRSMGDPYYLAMHAVDRPPPNTTRFPIQPRVCMMHQDPDFGYATFFVMSRVNENVVRWSNALQDYRYGHDFVYYEMLACSFNLLTAFLAMMATYLSLFAVGCPITRYAGRMLGLIPSPGQGPAQQTLNGGYFSVEAVGKVAEKTVIRARIASNQGDPGYKETAKMITECALSLALEMPQCTKLTGAVSPSAGIGEPLIKRLRDSGILCDINVETDTAVRPATKKI